MINGMHTYPSQTTSTQKKKLNLHSGIKDLTFPSCMQMTLAHETLMFSGKPPERPPDQEMVRNVSQHVAPLIDPGGVGTLGGHGTTQRVWVDSWKSSRGRIAETQYVNFALEMSKKGETT